MPADGLKWIIPGWYTILEYTSQVKNLKFHQRRIFIAAPQRAAIVDKDNRQWYEIPTDRGNIYVRLARAQARAKPCTCPARTFPHRRTALCTGDYDGES